MDRNARKVILIKHPETQLVPDVPAAGWQLTERGRTQCEPLAERLRAYGIQVVVSSTEQKAIEAAQLVARRLGVPVDTQVGLHEHDRANVRLVARAEFEAHMAAYFARPDERVYGLETADETHRRFRQAVERVSLEHREGNVALMTHGTVMALLTARANGIDPFELWRQLTLPSFLVLEAGNFRLLEMITNIC